MEQQPPLEIDAVLGGSSSYAHKLLRNIGFCQNKAS